MQQQEQYHGYPNQISALIDNRTNRSADFQSALTVTALGQARELLEKDRNGPLALFLHRHPELEPFCMAPSIALVMVRRYILAADLTRCIYMISSLFPESGIRETSS